MNDTQKVATAVEAILTPHINSTAAFVFVRSRDFYESCRLNRLSKRSFTDEIQSQLTSSGFCNRFGEWLFTEYGDGYDVFVRVTKPNESHPGSTINRLVELGTAAAAHEFSKAEVAASAIGFSIGDLVENTKSGNSGVVVAIKDHRLVVRADDKTFLETECSEFVMSPSEVRLIGKAVV